MLFSFTNARHCAKAPSAAGAPRMRPSDGERRLVVHHQHRLDLLVGVLVQELHQRIDVEEADRIGACGNARDAGDRTGTGVDRDVQAFGLVVALVERDEVGRRRPLELPVEREFKIGLCRHRPGEDGRQCHHNHCKEPDRDHR
jgi:hypothetical protein